MYIEKIRKYKILCAYCGVKKEMKARTIHDRTIMFLKIIKISLFRKYTSELAFYFTFISVLLMFHVVCIYVYIALRYVVMINFAIIVVVVVMYV